MNSPIKWLMRLTAALAGGVSFYLLIVSLRSAGLPAGCGAGSGCAEVLSSRWAGTFGIPVSGPAAAAYLAALIAMCFLGVDQPLVRRRLAWMALIGMAVSIAAAAVWFIALQVFVLHAVCPWCMTGHALGLVLCVSTLVSARGESDLLRPRHWMLAIVLGLLMTALLIAGQFSVVYKPSKIGRLPAGQNADTGPGTDRVLQVLDGEQVLLPHDELLLGSPDAKHVLVVVFDYCCPHCRATHGYLMNAMQRYPGQIAVLALPMPMNQSCNKYVQETEPRFENACEIARLALAVWKLDRHAFAEFDSYLFELETPRDPVWAKRKAGLLVGREVLETALADEWIDRQIARNVEIYHKSRAERIPVIMGANIQTIVGEPESAELLYSLLESEWGVQAGPP